MEGTRRWITRNRRHEYRNLPGMVGAQVVWGWKAFLNWEWLSVRVRGMAWFICPYALPRVDGKCCCRRKGNHHGVGWWCPEGRIAARRAALTARPAPFVSLRSIGQENSSKRAVVALGWLGKRFEAFGRTIGRPGRRSRSR